MVNKAESLPASVRRARILAAFENSGFLSINELAQQFGVSGMTVRRDLTALDKRGLLERTHGGAVPVGVKRAVFDSEEPAFDHRRHKNARQKMVIARAAAAMIGPNESVGLDVGTTVLALAEAIEHRRDIRVLTSNLRAAMRLAEANVRVYTLAGQVRAPEFSVIGPQAVDVLASYYLDRVFIGISGLDADGLYDYSPEDTEVKRAFIANAESVVVLCDVSKFDRRALSRIASFDRVDHVVTDSAPPAEYADTLARAGISLIVANS